MKKHNFYAQSTFCPPFLKFRSVSSSTWCPHSMRTSCTAILPKQATTVCFVLSARRHMCTSPKHDVGLSLWPVSLKFFGCYSNLKENVSNNFKYSYLIYWAFMFLPQTGCYGLRRDLRWDYIYMHFLSNLNHDKKLVSEIDCSCRYIIFSNQCICLAQHWTLYITCWRLSHIWYKKSELKI